MDYSVVVYVAGPTGRNNHIRCCVNMLELDHVALSVVSIWSRVLPLRITITVKK
jgi:hypothetical protein